MRVTIRLVNGDFTGVAAISGRWRKGGKHLFSPVCGGVGEVLVI
jgi:hypothetical protein